MADDVQFQQNRCSGMSLALHVLPSIVCLPA
eukprot:COSAG02_NODE_38676_length_426_cov_0.917431_1_plen_30_part_01